MHWLKKKEACLISICEIVSKPWISSMSCYLDFFCKQSVDFSASYDGEPTTC